MSNETRQVSNITAKWTAAGTKSDGFGGASGLSIVGVIFPTTGFTGATVTFEVSPDGVNYGPLYYSPGDGTSAVVTIPKAASPSVVGCDPIKTLGVQYLRVVSASSEAANTTLKLICTPLQ